MALYVEVSHRIREILDGFSPLVEPLSIDEAFLDLTGIARDLADGRRIASEMKREIRDRERLTASAGVAPNKFLAKVASDLEKPDGLVVIPLEEVPTRLWPLPVERLWGVGPKTAERLREQGFAKIVDLVNAPPGRLARILGEGSAEHLLALAHGRDDRAVQTGREAKSISEERTYGEDLTRPADIDRALLARADGVARELRREGLVARTVHLKVRTGDFETVTRAKTLPEPTDLAEVVLEAARELFRDRIALNGRGVRLLGVGVSGLEPPGAGQPSLFSDERQEKLRALARTADEIREKFGKAALARARLLAAPKTTGTDADGSEDDAAEASSLPSVD
jgi:Nucleotidyltransferase/DNA polymerase involved in DNA repair